MKSILGTALVLIVLGVVVGLIIRGMIKDKKNGKLTCGGNCGSCGGCAGGSCHTANRR